MRSIRTKNTFCSYLIAVRLWHLDGFSSTSFGFANVRVRASSDARKFSGLSVQKTLTPLLLQGEKLAVTVCVKMGLTATVSTLGPWLGVLWSFGGCGVLGCVAGEQKWDTGVRSRGYTCLSFCLCLLLLFTKIRGGSDTRPHHQEPTVLGWTETGSQGKSLLQRAIFHKKKKSN